MSPLSTSYLSRKIIFSFFIYLLSFHNLSHGCFLFLLSSPVLSIAFRWEDLKLHSQRTPGFTQIIFFIFIFISAPYLARFEGMWTVRNITQVLKSQFCSLWHCLSQVRQMPTLQKRRRAEGKCWTTWDGNPWNCDSWRLSRDQGLEIKPKTGLGVSNYTIKYLLCIRKAFHLFFRCCCWLIGFF